MLHIIYKDLLQAFKDKKGLLLSFLLPIILISLFALVYGGFQNSRNDIAQQILFCDADQSALSNQLKSKLEAQKELKITTKSIEEAEQLIINGDFPSALIVQKGFSDSIDAGKNAPIEFIFDESREIEMGLTQKALMTTLMPFLGKQGSKGQIHSLIDQKYGSDLPDELLQEIHNDVESQFLGDADGESAGTTGIVSRAVAVKEEMPWGLIQAFAGTSVMMLLFSIAGMGGTLIRERETGTLKRILYSPVKPWEILMGKLTSGFIFAMIQMTILVTFVWLAFGLDIFRNLGGLIILTAATALAASGFGVFIAALAKNQKHVESLSLIIILVMSALGGSMMPLFLFPEFMKVIAHFTLNYWAIDGFFDVLGRDVGIVGALYNSSVLLAFAAVTSLLAIFIYYQNLKKDF
jgi:ABC-type Na+ efflux pump permease subunit